MFKQHNLKKFGRNNEGNVTIVFGLSVVSLFAMVGGAVDVGRFFSARMKAQSALDSAVIAGGRALQLSSGGDSAAAVNAATNYFQSMMPAGAYGGSPTFTAIESGTVLQGSVSFTVQTPFLSVIGLHALQGTILAEAALASGGNAAGSLEVSLMLDVTGSMSGQKIADLKAAAKDLIDIVVWTDQSQHTSKIAIAPFAARVNVGSYVQQLTGMSATWSGRQLKPCVTERTGSAAYTDEAPGTGAWLNAYGGDRNSDTSNYNYSGSCNSPSEQIMPLTSDKDALKAHVDTFSADGSTAGALGTAWAWYLISPNWDLIWPQANRPGSYADLATMGPAGLPILQKVAVLMTDGIYNTRGGTSFGDASSEAASISESAVAICTNMKASGIKVYTIGFQLGSNQLAIDTLKGCATLGPDDPANQPSNFFNAASGDELRAAFRQIALQLSTLRLRS